MDEICGTRVNIPWQLTPASSKWSLEQLINELCEQSIRLLSLPLHSTLLRKIGPTPTPKWASVKATASVGICEVGSWVFEPVWMMFVYNLYWYWYWPLVEYPSCKHTTLASVLPQTSSHTVPHWLFTQISTLPSFSMLPPTSRSLPVVQGAVFKELYIMHILTDWMQNILSRKKAHSI